jgi:response regulator RpfG family c-di-GMP phosphodiesterase
MNDRILCVDDDPNVLQAYQRALRKRFHLEIALGPEEALDAVVSHGPFAVVVADMRMPGMDGVQLLAKVRKHAPDTVRIMLTGNADQQTAIDAVNEGHIFRFLTKPCPPEVFARALEAGIEQHRLITAERDLLSKTLSGSVKVLTDVLSLANPQAFGRTARVRPLVARLCEALRPQRTWAIEIAAMLSQIGCISIPPETLAKIAKHQPLSPKEAQAYQSHPAAGAQLLAKIPRLEEVAEIVAYQNKRYDGEGFPPDRRLGAAIPLGSRILKVALDWDALVSDGLPEDLAIAEMNDREGWYDPIVLEALRALVGIPQAYVIRQVRVDHVPVGAVLADDVRSLGGTMLCAKGQEVTAWVRARLRGYATSVGIAGPIRIFVPVEESSGFPAEAAPSSAPKSHSAPPAPQVDPVPPLDVGPPEDFPNSLSDLLNLKDS